MIALFLASQFLVVGVALAIWLCATSIVLPFYKGAAFVLASPKLQGHRGRALMVTGLGLVSLAALLFVLPAPLASARRRRGVGATRLRDRHPGRRLCEQVLRMTAMRSALVGRRWRWRIPNYLRRWR